MDPGPLFSMHGVEESAIYDPNARISSALVDAISVEANRLIGDPFFGLKEANYFRPAHIGPLGFAWLASNTLAEALARLQRYATVISDHLIIHLAESSETISVTLEDSSPSLDCFQRDSSAVSVLVKMCRFLCGDQWNPGQVFFTHVEPPDTSLYFSYFRCPTVFAAKCNGIQVDLAAARQRITGADEYLAQLNDHIVLRYLAHRSQEDIVNRTRVAILDCLNDGKATESLVASELAMSSRQLNRRLKEEGSSFRNLLLECRLELAEQYLSDSSLSLTEISFLLGFAEASSFSRAFRRWTGVTPSEARNQIAPPHIE